MKRKIFVFFACMLLCIQLFITPAHADEVITDWYTSYNSLVNINDVHSIFYFGGVVNSDVQDTINSNYSKDNFIYGYAFNRRYVFKMYLTDDADLYYDSENSKIICKNATFVYVQQNISDGYWQVGGLCNEGPEVNFSFDTHEIVYSSVDIYDKNGDLKHEHTYGPEDYQYHYAPDIDVSYYPELSLDMDFSYENPGGSRDEYGRPIPSIEYNYNITGTVDYNGSWTYQFCVLVSEAPPNVVFEEGINPTQDKFYVDFNSYKENSIFTVCQDTYYWCTYNNPNYGDIDFVQAKGVIGWFVASPGKDSHFTLNLQRVPGFSPDKTYYITLWGYERPEGETATFTYLPAAYSFDDIETQGHSIQLVDCQAFGTTKALVDYEDTSHKNKFTQSDNSYVDFTGTGDNLFNGGIIPESAVHTPTTDGITGPITSIKPNNDSNLSDSFTVGEFSLMGLASQFVPFLTASLSILPDPIGGILLFSMTAVLACCLVAVLFKLLSKLLG